MGAVGGSTRLLPKYLSSTRYAAARTSTPLASKGKDVLMCGQPPISAAVILKKLTLRQRGFARITTAVFARRMRSAMDVPRVLDVVLTVSLSGQAPRSHLILFNPLLAGRWGPSCP